MNPRPCCLICEKPDLALRPSGICERCASYPSLLQAFEEGLERKPQDDERRLN